MQFLEFRYDTPAKLESYADLLFKTFPPTHDTVLRKSGITVDAAGSKDSKKSIYHIASLNFRESCTDRGKPLAQVAEQLCDEICTDGFTTADEVIRIDASSDRLTKDGIAAAPWSKLDKLNDLPAFGIGFERGVGRITTLHMMITLMLDDEVDIAKACSSLFNSICNINATFFKHPSKQASRRTRQTHTRTRTHTHTLS
jgi:hypothetical protein